jgi:hypothetical protein
MNPRRLSGNFLFLGPPLSPRSVRTSFFFILTVASPPLAWCAPSFLLAPHPYLPEMGVLSFYDGRLVELLKFYFLCSISLVSTQTGALLSCPPIPSLFIFCLDFSSFPFFSASPYFWIPVLARMGALFSCPKLLKLTNFAPWISPHRSNFFMFIYPRYLRRREHSFLVLQPTPNSIFFFQIPLCSPWTGARFSCPTIPNLTNLFLFSRIFFLYVFLIFCRTPCS